MTDLVIADFSQWQGVVHPPAGQVVIIRAHNGYVADPDFVANRAAAHAAGCPAVGLYQYLPANLDAGSAAAFLVSTTRPLGINEWLICDLEEGQGDQQPRWQAWHDETASATGRRPWLYSGLAFAHAHDLDPDWVAAYGQTEPTMPHKLWQDTDRYPWPWGASDASIFHGTLPEFLAAAGIALPGPIVPALSKEDLMAQITFIAHTPGGEYLVDIGSRLVAHIGDGGTGSAFAAPASPTSLGLPYVAADAATLKAIVTGTPADQIV